MVFSSQKKVWYTATDVQSVKRFTSVRLRGGGGGEEDGAAAEAGDCHRSTAVREQKACRLGGSRDALRAATLRLEMATCPPGWSEIRETCMMADDGNFFLEILKQLDVKLIHSVLPANRLGL